MNKIHVTVVALILGVSGAFGVAAATHTAGLRATTAKAGVSDATVAARAHRLDKVARDIARARRDKPPALPAVPARASTRSQPQRVVYQRPAPVVVVKHNGQHESEHESEGGQEGGDD